MIAKWNCLSLARFMPRYDDRLELAPRDVVARAIQNEMLTAGTGNVWLDISHKPKSEVLSHFPNIAKQCAEYGIDISSAPIPVAPAQHYMCGGVMVSSLPTQTQPPSPPQGKEQQDIPKENALIL